MEQTATSLLARLRARSSTLAEEVVRRQGDLHAHLPEGGAQTGRQRCLEDSEAQLRYLLECVETGSAALFMDYVHWAGVVLESRSAQRATLVQSLECLRDVLREECREGELRLIEAPLTAGLAALRGRLEATDSHLAHGALQPLASSYLDALIAGRRHDAVRLIHEAVGAGAGVRDVYLRVFQPVQRELGRLWQRNAISVAQEHYGTAVTQLVMSQLYGHFRHARGNGCVMVCACVGGDLHELGARMVADLFELDGWDTHYLGANTPVAGIVEQVQGRGADVVGLSATMAVHLATLREAIAGVRAASDAAIVVGGRPFLVEAELWRHVGADGFAADAHEAVAVGEGLVQSDSR